MVFDGLFSNCQMAGNFAVSPTLCQTAYDCPLAAGERVHRARAAISIANNPLTGRRQLVLRQDGFSSYDPVHAFHESLWRIRLGDQSEDAWLREILSHVFREDRGCRNYFALR